MLHPKGNYAFNKVLLFFKKLLNTAGFFLSSVTLESMRNFSRQAFNSDLFCAKQF